MSNLHMPRLLDLVLKKPCLKLAGAMLAMSFSGPPRRCPAFLAVHSANFNVGYYRFHDIACSMIFSLYHGSVSKLSNSSLDSESPAVGKELDPSNSCIIVQIISVYGLLFNGFANKSIKRRAQHCFLDLPPKHAKGYLNPVHVA